ncbi:MAG: AAA family ATPase [Bacteroidales bacterium]|nr:AAA family ATPase [Bacteroidales bacterium]
MARKPKIDLSSISDKEIKAEVNKLEELSEKAKESKGLFTVKTANSWIKQAKNRPIPKKLFGDFWLESEICILFADTNLGKSILAVQIANSISKGEPISGFIMETIKQKVLLTDFELSDKQFEARYSLDYTQHYQFDDNFFRVEIDPDALIPDGQTFEDYLNSSLERSIIETGARVIIIDNITYLKNENEKAKDALPLMQKLKALKTKYGLSILALAHTPKRDLSKPITRNDLSGSKMLMNFCDNSFAIGESSKDKSIRYIKHIKARNTEIIHDSENVCVCMIEKPFNFLQFEIVDFGTEREHLKQYTEKDNDNMTEKILEMKQLGRSLREIGAELGISHMKVSRILKDCNN